MNKIVELKNISKHYQRGFEDVHALNDFTLEINKGELVVITGPSGCGKSTCLNIVSGVDKPSDGEVLVCGENLVTASENKLIELRRNKIGVIFQAFYLIQHITVEENVSLPLALAGKKSPDRVSHLIDRVGLTKRIKHFPSELSGGEQQRVAVARAMVHRPEILLADEPTGNLDSHSSEAVLNLMDELRREEQTAMLLATHDMKITKLADRHVKMLDGHQVNNGS